MTTLILNNIHQSDKLKKDNQETTIQTAGGKLQ